MNQSNSFNTLKNNLTETDIDQLVELLGYRCRVKTCVRLRSILTYSASMVPQYGIFERLVRESDGQWKYFAGQDYSAEMKTLRQCLIK